MSQAGALSGSGSGGLTNVQKIAVQTGTSPVVADASNQITFNGAVVAAGVNPVRTDGTGPNTMALEVQTSQAIAATNASNIGLSAFNSAQFTVDANGFVSLIGGGLAIDSINVDAATPPGTDPVVPDGTGQITLTGAQVAAGTIGANVIRTDSLAANSLTIEIQRSTAVAATDSTNNGVSHFDSAEFDVDANGFVGLQSSALGVLSVSGTADRITSTGGQNPVIDIAATYVGQTSITTLGTIATGVWNGTAVDETHGGTNQTTYAQGDILYASGVNTLSKLPATTNGFVLTLSGGVPIWASNPSGDVVGPAGATSTAIAVYDGTTGKLIANSIPTIDSSGNILTSASLSGATLSMDVVNSSNTANSTARMSTTVAGSSGGDALFQTSVSGGQTWSLGLDNSDSDAFVMSSNSSLGTNNVMRVATTGQINYPLQPSFFAYLANSQTDVTGDGTLYTVPFDTEDFDVGSNFASNTFTAPVAGKYYFYAQVLASQAVATMTATIRMTISGNNYINGNSGTTFTGNVPLNMSAIVNMAASDTAIVQINFGNGTKVVDVYGAAGDRRTYFTGYLIG